MKHVTVHIPDNKYQFFMELVGNLPFLQISEEEVLTKKQKEFVEGTRKSLMQVEQHIKGEIELKTAAELLDEL